MTARRELWLAVLLCLAGSALVLFGTSQTWAVVRAVRFGTTATDVTGDQISGAAQALGYVGLAAVVALAATRRWGRVVVGLLVLLAGIGIVVALARVLGEGLATRALEHAPGQECSPGSQETFCGVVGVGGSAATEAGWVWVCLSGGALMALSGLLVTVRGRHWAALSSSYEPPSARATAPPVTDKGVWDALDRGEDPTAP